MSTRSTYAMRGERAAMIVAGSFGVDAGNSIVNIEGEGFTVTRVSAGRYAVRFDKTFPKTLSATATRQSTAVVAQFCSIVGKTATGFDVYLWDVAAAAVVDPGTNTDDRINFVAVMKDSSV